MTDRTDTAAAPATARQLVAEGLGTAFLLATIAGSGIMGERLAAGQAGAALLPHSLAIGAILFVMITLLGPVSGAHFNPAVTLAFAIRKEISARDSALYVAAQVIGGIAGVIIAHAMFDNPLIDPSTTARTGTGQWIGEFVATFGLVATILGCLKSRPDAVPYAVGLFITAGYWFTSSTSFANPAVTIGRAFTDSFTGIRAADAPAFIVAEIVGAVAATLVFRWLLAEKQPSNSDATH